MNSTHLKQSAIRAFFVATASLTVLSLCYVLIEPVVGRAAAGPGPFDFRIRQTITDESTFLVAPANVTMAGNLQGVTGGTATGTTYFVVRSNNFAGYRVDIRFFNNSTPNAMIGDEDSGEEIRDYNEFGLGEPTFAFTPSTSAQFGYTVYSSSSITDPSFLHDGSLCNNGGTTQSTGNTCWMEPRTTDFTIVNSSGPQTDGATTTIQFKVNVPSNATPAPVAQTYTATATLSLIVN